MIAITSRVMLGRFATVFKPAVRRTATQEAVNGHSAVGGNGSVVDVVVGLR